jgi:hypothetical protein
MTMCDRIGIDLGQHNRVEKWLHGEVVKSYDEFAADPSTGIPTSDVMARPRASHRERLAKLES